jgi:hypothetical protein
MGMARNRLRIDIYPEICPDTHLPTIGGESSAHDLDELSHTKGSPPRSTISAGWPTSAGANYVSASSAAPDTNPDQVPPPARRAKRRRQRGRCPPAAAPTRTRELRRRTEVARFRRRHSDVGNGALIY